MVRPSPGGAENEVAINICVNVYIASYITVSTQCSASWLVSVNRVHSKSLERQFVEADGNITATLALSKRCAHSSIRRCVFYSYDMCT